MQAAAVCTLAGWAPSACLGLANGVPAPPGHAPDAAQQQRQLAQAKAAGERRRRLLPPDLNLEPPPEESPSPLKRQRPPLQEEQPPLLPQAQQPAGAVSIPPPGQGQQAAPAPQAVGAEPQMPQQDAQPPGGLPLPAVLPPPAGLQAAAAARDGLAHWHDGVPDQASALHCVEL